MLENPEILLLVLPILLFSIVIHEMAHGYAALFQGDPTAKNMGRLTLNPIVHLDPIWSVLVPSMTLVLGGFFFGMAKPVLYNPRNFKDKKWGEAKVAFAGPLSNIVIAFIFALMVNLLPALGIINPQLAQALFLVVAMNLFLAFLNLIPIPPLDGSKLLFAVLPPSKQHIRYTLERYSLVLILILLFILLNTGFLGTAVFSVANLFII